MMKEYTAPEFKAIALDSSDILTASGFVPADGPADDAGTETPIIGDDRGDFGLAE